MLIDARDIRRLGRHANDGGEGGARGRFCKCCALPDAELSAINAAILARESYRNIAKRLTAGSIGHVSIQRHALSHVFPELLRLIEENGGQMPADAMDPARIIRDLGELREDQQARALMAEDNGVSANNARTAHLIGKTGLELAGRLQAGTAVQVNVGTAAIQDTGPAMMKVVSEVLKAHPDLLHEIAVRLAMPQDANLIEGTAAELPNSAPQRLEV